MSLISPDGSFVCREERHQHCLRPVPLVVRLLRRLLVPYKRFRAAYSRRAVHQGIGRSRGLKWWSWRTLRLWTTKGKWRVRAHYPDVVAVLSVAYTSGRRCPTWPSAWRKSEELGPASRQQAGQAHFTIFDLRRMRCSARWPFSGTFQCNVACLWRAAGARPVSQRRARVNLLACAESTLKCRTAFLHRRNGMLHTGHKYTGLVTSSPFDSSPESASPVLSAPPVRARAAEARDSVHT